MSWSADDPRIDDLARASVAEAERITTTAGASAIRELPPTVDAIVAACRGDAPAWEALSQRAQQLTDR